jgi:DNA-binding PadR family transcriptional regulator
MGSTFDAFGRYARPARQVVTVLTAGPRVPTAIRREIGSRCGDDIGPGTLFGTLARLERRALIEVVPAPSAPRAYRLTALGATTLEAELGAIVAASSGPARGPTPSWSPAR